MIESIEDCLEMSTRAVYAMELGAWEQLCYHLIISDI